MTEVQRAPAMQEPSQPRAIPERKGALRISPLSTVTLPPPASASKIRSSHLGLDTFSPVNQNGSFEFDRVLKSGHVQKRTRKTKVCPTSAGHVFLMLTSDTGLEINLLGTSAGLPVNIQRQERREITPQDTFVRPHRRSLPEGP